MEIWLTNKDHIATLKMVKQEGPKHSNESNSEELESNKTFAIPNLMPHILSEDEITESINSLNLKQKKVFNVVHTWL